MGASASAIRDITTEIYDDLTVRTFMKMSKSELDLLKESDGSVTRVKLIAYFTRELFQNELAGERYPEDEAAWQYMVGMMKTMEENGGMTKEVS
jgi:hypothetical protein